MTTTRRPTSQYLPLPTYSTAAERQLEGCNQRELKGLVHLDIKSD